MCRPEVFANEHTIYMRNILRIFDAWHESFARISSCLSVAFFIVLTGFFLRTGHWLLVLALSIVICAGLHSCGHDTDTNCAAS